MGGGGGGGLPMEAFGATRSEAPAAEVAERPQSLHRTGPSRRRRRRWRWWRRRRRGRRGRRRDSVGSPRRRRRRPRPRGGRRRIRLPRRCRCRGTPARPASQSDAVQSRWGWRRWRGRILRRRGRRVGRSRFRPRDRNGWRRRWRWRNRPLRPSQRAVDLCGKQCRRWLSQPHLCRPANRHLESTSIAFGTQALGTTSDPRYVTLTNSGHVPMIVDGLAPKGADAGDFSRDPRHLPAGWPPRRPACWEHFQSHANGPRSGTLLLFDNAPDSPQNITVTGNPAPATATLSSTSIAFGSRRSARSVSPSVTLTNNGDLPMDLDGLGAAGPTRGVHRRHRQLPRPRWRPMHRASWARPSGRPPQDTVHDPAAL